MIIVTNERGQYFCSQLKNVKCITDDIKLAVSFKTEEEAKQFVWYKEWKQRNKCSAIYLTVPDQGN